MPEVVETESWKSGLPKKGRERPLSKVGRVYQCTPLRGEDKALVFVETAEELHLLHLKIEVPFESFHRPFCKPDRPTAPLSLGFAKDEAPLVAAERASNPD